MSFQSKDLQELASSARSLFPHATGDISTIIWTLRRLDAGVSKLVADAVARNVIAWCNQHGLTNFCGQLLRAHRHYTRMREYYLLPKVAFPHNQTHKVFARVAKINFDDHGQVWNGFRHGRKNPDGSPDMTCKENCDKRRLLKKCQSSDFHRVIQALANGFRKSYFVSCQVLAVTLDQTLSLLEHAVRCLIDTAESMLT
jgi:hypothetical protein